MTCSSPVSKRALYACWLAKQGLGEAPVMRSRIWTVQLIWAALYIMVFHFSVLSCDERFKFFNLKYKDFNLQTCLLPDRSHFGIKAHVSKHDNSI